IVAKNSSNNGALESLLFMSSPATGRHSDVPSGVVYPLLSAMVLSHSMSLARTTLIGFYGLGGPMLTQQRLEAIPRTVGASPHSSARSVPAVLRTFRLG